MDRHLPVFSNKEDLQIASAAGCQSGQNQEEK
jgi:hypothetical protein